MYIKYPRGIRFKDGKAIGTSTSANIEYDYEKVIWLPSDHYDFSGPINFINKTEEEICLEVEKFERVNNG